MLISAVRQMGEPVCRHVRSEGYEVSSLVRGSGEGGRIAQGPPVYLLPTSASKPPTSKGSAV